MIHLVAYDIAQEKRLNAVARVCEDFGIRIQKSLFVCNLGSADFVRLWQRLAALIDDEEDRIVDYPICETCWRKQRMLGGQAVASPLGENAGGWIF